jgi:serine/threonine protein kinase
VYLVKRKQDDKLFAMKSIVRAHLSDRQLDYIMRERRVLEAVNTSPFIAKLHYAFKTNDALLFVMEYSSGGELLFHLQRFRKFGDKQTRFYVAEIVLALEALHNKDIIYRDLKPENILLDAKVSFFSFIYLNYLFNCFLLYFYFFQYN